MLRVVQLNVCTLRYCHLAQTQGAQTFALGAHMQAMQGCRGPPNLFSRFSNNGLTGFAGALSCIITCLLVTASLKVVSDAVAKRMRATKEWYIGRGAPTFLMAAGAAATRFPFGAYDRVTSTSSHAPYPQPGSNAGCKMQSVECRLSCRQPSYKIRHKYTHS